MRQGDTSSEPLPDNFWTDYTELEQAEYWNDRAARVYEHLGAPIRAQQAREAKKAAYIRESLTAFHAGCDHPAEARRVIKGQATENAAGAVIEELDEVQCILCYQMLGAAS